MAHSAGEGTVRQSNCAAQSKQMCFSSLDKILGHAVLNCHYSVQEVIDKILKTKGEKAPLKYVEHIEVEEFTMGMVPPRFHFCNARYNPTRNYLQLEAEMAFKSSGFQLVVCHCLPDQATYMSEQTHRHKCPPWA